MRGEVRFLGRGGDPGFFMRGDTYTQSAIYLPYPMLTGSELLAKVKELGPASKSDIVRACGFITANKDGTERLNFTAFYEALLQAKGVELVGNKKPGRKLPYRAKVQFNGALQVGEAYLSQIGAKPGDEFEIRLGRNQITLIAD